MADPVPTVDEMRSRDLSPSLVAREKAAKPTWFVKRLGDGYTFAVEEKEAWDILNNGSNWKRHDFQFIGYSDGKTYQRIAAEATTTAARLEPAIAAKKVEIARYVALEDRLMIDEVVDMEGDPSDTVNEANKAKMKRLQDIRSRLNDELEKMEAEYRNATANAVRAATEAELKVAMENWAIEKVWPRDDMNIFTPSASPKERAKIVSKMNG